MNYTNYFSGIKIENISMQCTDCIKKLRNLKTNTFYKVNTCCSAPSIDKLGGELRKNYSQIDTVITYIKGYARVLSYADLIKKQQLKMKDTTDYSVKEAYAKKISSELKIIATLVDNLQMASSASASNGVISALAPVTSSSSTKSLYTFSSIQVGGTLKINYTKLKSLKSDFDSFGVSLCSAYRDFYSLKSTVSKDGYLNYGWYKVICMFQKVMKKRDNLDNWWTNYMYNLKNIENQLPDNTKFSIKTVTSKKYAGSSSFQSLNAKKPILSEYAKKGATKKILKSNIQIALEVLAGKCGNDEARKKALTAAGYDYAAVQSIVNSLVRDVQNGTNSSSNYSGGDGSGSNTSTTSPSRSFSSRSTSGYHTSTTGLKSNAQKTSDVNYTAINEYNKALEQAKKTMNSASDEWNNDQYRYGGRIYEEGGKVYQIDQYNGKPIDITGTQTATRYSNLKQAQKNYVDIATQGGKYRSTSGY